MDPSQHSFALIALVLSTGLLALADCLISRQCASAGGGSPAAKFFCGPALRTALRAGQAAGFLAVFAMAGLSAVLSLALASAAYLLSTLLLSDFLVARAALRRERITSDETSAPGAPGDESPAGLSVVASRAERLKDIPISRLMVPRKSIVACDSSASVKEVASIMRETGFSRVIAFAKTLDRPLGLAHIKDVLPMIYDGKGKQSVESLLRPLVLVPSATSALNLLRDFQRLKRRVAIVRDLQGERTLGLVSTEDILEEMVGEIQDEREALSAALESGVALVRGDLKVSDLTEGLGMPPYQGKGDVSVGELVGSLLGKEARKGDAVRFRGLRMAVEETINGDIWMVRIDKNGN